jgi:hypothetical protein
MIDERQTHTLVGYRMNDTNTAKCYSSVNQIIEEWSWEGGGKVLRK